MRFHLPHWTLISLFLAAPAFGQTDTIPPMEQLGGPMFSGWTGLTPQTNGSAAMKVPGEAVFQYPDGLRGFYKHGFRVLSDSTADWHPRWGVRCEVKLPDDRQLELVTSITPLNRSGPLPKVNASAIISGEGWHQVMLPWSAFQFEQEATSFLRFVKLLTISAHFTDGGAPATIVLRNVRVVKAPEVALECSVAGKAAAAGQMAEYSVQVSNCTDQPQSVALSLVPHGWEVMETTIDPAAMELAPGQTLSCTVRVKMSERVPPGGHEVQMMQAVGNGNAGAAAQLSLITVCQLPHPYVLHTPARWQEVRDKVARYAWAKAALDGYVAQAHAWQVPEVAAPPHNDPDDTMGPFLFATQNENSLLACGYAWQLTGDKESAGKVAEFLRRLSNPQNGYPKTLRGCNMAMVQEGHFFQHIAMSYDMILDAGVLSDADRGQIEATFRLFMETIERASESGAINNWNLSESCGAFYCALAMQDLVAADRFFSGPAGIRDQLAKGTMDDGWWYECAIGYNMWCASEFTQAALAYEPFGINFKDMWVPASYSPKALLVSELSGGAMSRDPDPETRRKPFGMNPDIFGPTLRTFRRITDLWNSLIPFIDYRGVMFGVNDSAENQVTAYRTEVSAQPFEIAYYAYRDPAYAAVIKLGDGKRDLLYGVAELPPKTPEPYRDNAYADNVGLAMLRSQTKDRPIRQQIQAALHYGTHGWAHGHYDRTDLISLMRYGRSFYNPESVFHGYEPFMYKFYCQTSVNHNMVVVDEKMQEATPGRRLLFHTGKLMQAAVVQATARWSNPPYGGMVYDYVPVKTFAEKTWREGRSVPIPDQPPAYGTLTDFTEPVLQRRLMIVTDDYVLLADYLHGARQHTYESLLSIKGFKGLEAAEKKFLRHDPQWNPDPVGSAQFVTDCNWFSAQAPAVARFEMRWGPGADNAGSRSVGNVDGVLKLDVHSLWPPSQQIMIGTAPEALNTEKRLFYVIRGNGKTLAEGKFGAWILGKADVDVPLAGVTTLGLETRTELSKTPGVFWAEARIVTRDGKEIPLSQLPVKLENVVESKSPSQDYSGGPIKIVGSEYAYATPGEPKDARQPGLVRVDLTGIDAVSFKAVLGSDYPPGDESQRRRTYAIRSQGVDARFLTIIEPYEDRPVIKSAVASGADQVHVELTDGRIQEISLQAFDGNPDVISVTIQEMKNGTAASTETAHAGAN